MWSRRAFLKGSAMTIFASTLGGVPSFVIRSAQAQSSSLSDKRKKVICIFQRGAMDGLQAVQPLADKYLKQLRPDLIIPSTGEGKLIDLDGRFGLNPAFRGFDELFREGRFGIVHGIGSPVVTRSHFDAQDYMENGTPGIKNTPSGWLNRASGLLGHEPTPFQAVAVTPATPKILYGTNYSLTVENLDELKIMSSNNGNDKKNGFEKLYQQAHEENLRKSSAISMEAIRILQETGATSLKPSASVSYPTTPLGQSLKQIAQLIKAGVGLEIAFAESNGWDTHARQGAAYSGFVKNATDLSLSITAFWKDIEKYQEDVVLMTMTEFGRTVHQNGSLGTDHGRGSCMFVLGNSILGNRVYGTVPELAIENLEEGRDLPVTTDFRSLFSSILLQQFSIESNTSVFPEWNGSPLQIFK
jgi:uncharacterized protein (DUF1501 family)